MRRFIFTSLLVLMASFFANTHAADTFIAGFEPGETGYELNTGWAAGYTWEITNNSETSGINNSDKCMMTTTPGPNPDRWGLWVHVTLTEPMTITSENRYFKVMVKRSPNTAPMGLSLDEEPWGTGFYFGQTKPSKANVWCDIVFDLFNSDPGKTCENRQVKKFMICLGTWDGTEAGVCMLDNVALSADAKPRGATEIAPGLLLNLDNEALTTKNWAGFQVQSAAASYQVTTNPVKTAANSSDKVLKYNKPANTVWWHSLMCITNGIVPITYPNVFFHAMVYIPDATPVSITVKSTSGKSVTEKVYPEDGEGWYDYVVDASELDYVNEVDFRFNNEQDENWANPAGSYYVDDFVLSNSAEPRAKITTGMKAIVSEQVKVFAAGQTACVSASELKSATVYSVSGQLLQTKVASGSTLNFELPQGTYIIKVEGKAGNISTHKLAI